MCSGKAAPVAVTGAPGWSPAALAVVEVGSCRRRRRHRWLQGLRARSASSSAPPDGPAPAPAASPAAAPSPAGRQYQSHKIHTELKLCSHYCCKTSLFSRNSNPNMEPLSLIPSKKTSLSKFLCNFRTRWGRERKRTHLSFHLLFFQLNQRQPREVHHTCEHIRASWLSLVDHNPSNMAPLRKISSPWSEICCCPCLVEVTTTAAMSLT